MSREIDEKVVSMKFDNKQFMDSTAETMTRLDKLKSSLNLPGAAKGFEDINKAASNTNLSPVGTAAEQVSLKFNALQTIATTALAKITSAAMDAGIKIASALTIDPIKMGLQEYETQINSVQTILANTESKGTTLEDVTGALDQLNAYADKTIYNFTEMTRNIGTFTAAGVDLDTSVNAIQGIANLAAVSGSTSQQASTAMYQLSQALASGTVKLMDWNSVVNAGMGGQVFQDALKETARVHDIAIDDMIEENGSFRETLQEGWLTSEILTETLQKFTMTTEGLTDAQIEQNRAMLKSKGYTDEQIDGIFKLGDTATNAATKVKTFTQLIDTLKESLQSGWTQTWEILIGDFEEAKELWTSVSDVFGKMIGDAAEARNAVLQGWKDGGGRDDLIESFKNIFEAISSIVKPIKEAFNEIFLPDTAEQWIEQLIEITAKIKEFTASLKLNEKSQQKLKSVFKGVFAVIDIFLMLIKEVVKGVAVLAGGILKLVGGATLATSSFGDWLVGLRDTIKESGIFATVIGGIVKVLQKVIDGIKTAIVWITGKFSTPGFEGFAKVLSTIWNGIKMIASKIKDALGDVISRFVEAFKGGDIKMAVDIFNGGILGAILLGIKKFTDGLSTPFKGVEGILTSVSGFVKSFGEVFDSFSGYLDAMTKKVQSEILMKIAQAVLILVAAMVVISLLNPDKIGAALGVITTLLAELAIALGVFMAMSKNVGNLMSVSGVLVSMAFSVLVLASALGKISTMDQEGMTTGLIGLGVLAGIMIALTKVMTKKGKKVEKVAFSFLSFSLAIKILASAVEDLSKMDWDAMIKGLAGVGILLTAVALFVSFSKLDKSSFKTATGLFVIALAIKVLASTCKSLGEMDWKQMGVGLISLAGILLSLTLALRYMPSDLSKVAFGLIGTAIAIKLISSTIAQMGNMSWQQMGIGLITLAGALLSITLALRLMPQNMLAVATGLIGVSAALYVIASAIAMMGSMSWEQMGIGLLTLAGALAILAVALWAMSGTLAGSAALLVAAVAIGVLTASLVTLVALSWSGLVIGLIVIAGAFVILGVAGLALSALAPVILALAAAVALLGIGMLSAGAGLWLFATSLPLLTAGLLALAGALPIILPVIITAISSLATAFIGLIPTIVTAIGNAIVAICNVITTNAGAICNAIAAIIIAICDALIKAMPKIFELIHVLLDGLIDLIMKYVPKLIDCGIQLIIAFLDGIAQNIDQVVEKAVLVVTNFIDGIASQIPNLIDSAFNLILDFINSISAAVEEYTPLLIEACVNLGTSIVKGVVKGLASTPGVIWDAICEVGNSIKDGFCEFFGINSPAKEMMPIGRYIDEGVVVGLEKYKGSVASAAEDVGESAVKSMSNAISGISDAIDADIDSQPTIRPVLDLSNIESGASAINSMFGMKPSVDVLSNVGSINSSMNSNQNGGSFDIISAIENLGSKLGNMSGDTYIIDGITYDDGSNINNAVKSIIRAARIERRI